MANVISLKQILIILESIAERHYLINSFFVGDDNDLNAANIVYPVLQVKPEIARLPQNQYGEYKEVLLTLKCKILDRELQDGTNTNDVHSDTFRITQDIINEINQHPYYLNSNITLDGDIQIGNLSEFLDDYTAGWEFDLFLKIKNKNDFCGLPIQDLPGYFMSGPSEDSYMTTYGYITCGSITGCSNLISFIQSYIDANLSASTFTYVQPGVNTYTGGTNQFPTVNIVDSPSFNNLYSSGNTSLNVLSANTIYSAGTDLYNIFLTANDGNDITRVQNGLNTYTGGTGNLPTVNISAATLDNLIVSGSASFITIISGGTNLQNIINSSITSITSSLTSTRVQPGINTYTGGTPDNPTVNVTGGTFNSINVTGGTLSSGGTDLYNIFLTSADGNDITRVQPGTNIQTGGTDNDPIVSTVDSPSFNNIYWSGTANGGAISGATTIDGIVLLSGGTNLYDIFLTANDGNDITRVGGVGNIYTGGTANNPTINIVDSPSFNNIAYSGTSSGGNSIAVNVSATTFYSGSTNLNSIINSSITQITSGLTGSVNIDGLNTYTGGTVAAQTINVSAATLDHLSVSGNSVLAETSATTLSILNSGVTLNVYNDYSGNKINTGVAFSSIIGGTGNTINANLSNVNIIGGYNISGTNNNHTYTSNLVVTGTSMGKLYATQIFSGNTDVSLLFSPGIDTYVTAATYNDQILTIKQNQSQPNITVSMVDFTVGFMLGGM